MNYRPWPLWIATALAGGALAGLYAGLGGPV
jgi:hypothetical protein